ncbi:MAG: LysR family transcriptional regulator [Rhodobacteraceae bacterium]|uniref:LysR substrate-binding domain-containing protein n=1 Tax=Celeribacter sp. HF31 TaxID=2721558 RepID=UPI001430E5E2|nr:LysR substrate-binding domain-containing protein [Celeribacter sp. HF31]NIY79848.1 LysR family transcriptional regulator [Celeribacter sp. HF31]NVK44787.1 LysR family transcriptional regulator [Paracoccaceae bacterium]
MRRFVPSLTALLAFESAARHMNFTKAAEDLAVTQSGISRQISNLESLLGAKLFERVGSRLVLTEVAKSYLNEITSGLNQIEQASVNCVRGQSLEAALMICAHPTLASRWLTPRLQDFLKDRPETILDFVTTAKDINFTETRIDAAILRGRGTWTATRSQELFREELVVVGAPHVVDTLPSEDVLDFDNIATLQNASRPDLWLTWLRGAGLQHRGAIRGPRFPHSELLISAAKSGLGLAVVPLLYVETELQNKELALAFGGPVPTADSYWLVQPEQRAEIPAAHQFSLWIKDQARQFRRDVSHMRSTNL